MILEPYHSLRQFNRDESEYIINMKSCDKSPGLIARKIWQVLFTISNAADTFQSLDSFLCDLGILTRYIEGSKGNNLTLYWNYYVPLGHTNLLMYYDGSDNCYQIELRWPDQQVVITKETSNG